MLNICSDVGGSSGIVSPEPSSTSSPCWTTVPPFAYGLRREWLLRSLLPYELLLEVDGVREEENERAGVDVGVVPFCWFNFRDLASASARAVRYAWAERPLKDAVEDFCRPNTGDCIGEAGMSDTEVGGKARRGLETNSIGSKN